MTTTATDLVDHPTGGPAPCPGAAPRDRAEAVDVALAGIGLPAGLMGVEQALDERRHHELAVALVVAGWPGARDARSVLHGALVATLAREAVAAGTHRWEPTPSGTRLVDGDGVELPLDEWAAEALGDVLTPDDDGAPSGPPLADPPPAVEASPVDEPADAPAALPEPVRAIPAAPSPPFGPATAPFVVEARLPAGLGRKALVQVGADAIALNGSVVRFEDVAHVELRLPSSDGSGARILVVDAEGREASVKLAAERKRGLEVADAIGYTWALLATVVGPRLRAAVVADLRAGGEAVFGDLVLTAAGVARRKRGPVTPWSGVGRAFVAQSQVAVPAGEATHRVPVQVRDAFLLIDLVAELRALHTGPGSDRRVAEDAGRPG